MIKYNTDKIINTYTACVVSDHFPKPTKIASIDARWKLNPCLVHSFAMTENYIILPEQPLTIDVKSMVTNSVKEKPFVDGMEWMADKLVINFQNMSLFPKILLTF